jgi:phosphinothricin acetyltransferase
MPVELRFRSSAKEDVPALTRVHAHWVRHGLASSEEEPFYASEMGPCRYADLRGGYTYLATEAAGAVLGCAHASAYRMRQALIASR